VLLLLGLELALNSWLVLGIPLLLLIIVKQALAEETMLLRSLQGYDAYCRQTKRFIPFLI
jgi:protein-S-isoprenylcysteine O-methyltransferase Ste14